MTPARLRAIFRGNDPLPEVSGGDGNDNHASPYWSVLVACDIKLHELDLPCLITVTQEISRHAQIIGGFCLTGDLILLFGYYVQILTYQDNRMVLFREIDLREQFKISTLLLLSPATSFHLNPGISWQEIEERDKQFKHTVDLAFMKMDVESIAVFFCAPVLEALCKRLLKDHINNKGTIYKPIYSTSLKKTFKNGDQMSRISEVLTLTKERFPKWANEFEEIEKIFLDCNLLRSAFRDPRMPSDFAGLIYYIRNDTLHSAGRWAAGYWFLIYTCILLTLESEDAFEDARIRHGGPAPLWQRRSWPDVFLYPPRSDLGGHPQHCAFPPS